MRYTKVTLTLILFAIGLSSSLVAQIAFELQERSELHHFVGDDTEVFKLRGTAEAIVHENVEARYLSIKFTNIAFVTEDRSYEVQGIGEYSIGAFGDDYFAPGGGTAFFTLHINGIEVTLDTGEGLNVYLYPYTVLGISGYDREHRFALVLFLRPSANVLPLFFLRGDANGDGKRTITDAILILSHLFLAEKKLPCLDAADTNDDGQIEITDAVYLLTYLFLGGNVPSSPSRFCGLDPTVDELGCEGEDICLKETV